MTMHISTADDYERLFAEMLSKTKTLRQTAEANHWDPLKLRQAIADSELPYRTLFSDPANPDVINIVRAVEFERMRPQYNGQTISQLNAQENPELFSILAKQTQMLNQRFGVGYDLPGIVLIEGEEGKPASPFFEPQGDVIVIDRATLKLLQANPAMTEVILGHEIGHRYLRDPATLETNALVKAADRIEAWDPALYEAKRAVETQADFIAAFLTSPEALQATLKDYIAPNSSSLFGAYLRAEGIKLDFTTDPAVIENYRKAFQALPLEERQTYIESQVQKPDATHPTTMHRMEMAQALLHYPELLQATDVRFDGEANFAAIENQGRIYTPAQLADINRTGDEQARAR